jgi:hypothetical protein
VARGRGALRSLRALRHDPPGYAKQGGRRAMFQSSLEQREQFLAAAGDTGYATRPVQLFYALSQAGRAIVAASPRVGNQAWKVSGHGLTADTSAAVAADVTVTATKTGLFPAVASALGVQALVPGEAAVLRELWPLLPETADVPLVANAMLPALLFCPSRYNEDSTFSSAEIDWVPRQVHDQYSRDLVRLKEHLDHYPALRDSTLCESYIRGGSLFEWLPTGRVDWRTAGPGMGLRVKWAHGEMPLEFPDHKTLGELGVACYRSADDLIVTPAIGSMTVGLHPLLALWAVLLALSSLARYEPVAWAKMIDIDRSAEANPIEHLLEEALESIPAAVLYLLTTFR